MTCSGLCCGLTIHVPAYPFVEALTLNAVVLGGGPLEVIRFG